MKFNYIKIFSFTIFLFICSFSFSQFEDSYAGARSAGMGKSSLTLTDVWSVLNNPAGTGKLSNYQFGFYYESRFLMKELNHASLAFTCPLMSGNINFATTYFGYSLFSQTKIALGYSQQLFKNFYMGLQINYFLIHQSEYYKNFNAMTFELGINYNVVKNLTIAAYVFNPINAGYFESYSTKIPISMKLGVSYLFADKFLLAVETGKSINGIIPVFKTGLEYIIKEHFAIRAGLAVKELEFSAGFGYNNYNLHVDVAYSYHQILGHTPKVSINYAF